MKSSMKVGIDGVLLGAWGAVEGKRGIDIGCGCGVIALMAAQRNREAIIDAIDIHVPSVEESRYNFLLSPWSNRLQALELDIEKLIIQSHNLYKYDFILSNPPYFKSGIMCPRTAREIARHAAGLSPAKLLEAADKLLKDGGTLSLIMPTTNIDEITATGEMFLFGKCLVADRPGRSPKRLLVTFKKGIKEPVIEEQLYIRTEEGMYSHQYRALTRDFYLKF